MQHVHNASQLYALVLAHETLDHCHNLHESWVKGLSACCQIAQLLRLEAIDQQWQWLHDHEAYCGTWTQQKRQVQVVVQRLQFDLSSAQHTCDL